ncbi:DNA polymerase I [Allohahella sp. A8]|uniref:DNA polymerase I n=1 Tax=Allohahella sp. A8 TaxID=3141461 RepID=UPI003A806830
MSKQTQAPVILVDGSSYLFRAFHALPNLSNAEGHPTGAIKGVIGMTKKLQKEYPGSCIIVVFDAKGDTFRNELYAEYKANRPPMAEDLGVQIKPIHDIIRAMGLPLIIESGVEADDVIGTLARQATESQHECIISTGDKDLAQLVSEHVTLRNTMTELCLDRAGVKEKFGVWPEQIVDYLALVGDTSDNIPGVPKCGPKTAAKWLELYETLDGVVANADKISGKVGEYLRDSLEQLPLAKQLTTIKTDVELSHPLHEIAAHEPDVDALKALYQQFNFKAWLTELTDPGEAVARSASTPVRPGSITTVTPADLQLGINSEAIAALAAPLRAIEPQYETVLTRESLDRWLKLIRAAELFSFDTETNSLNYMEAEIVGFSLCVEPGIACYVPLKHDYMDAPEQLDRDEVLELMRPILEDPEQRKLGHNLKYDAHVLLNCGITLRGVAEDTILASYVLNSVASRHNMDALALHYLQLKTTKFEDVAGKGAKQLTFNQVALEQATPYAAEDADVTLRLHLLLSQLLAQTPSLDSVYREIELPLEPILVDIEHTGCLINSHELRIQSQKLAERLAEIETQTCELVGEKFNLGSPKQLQTILYDQMKLPVLKKTPKGQPSTAEAVLQELAENHELPALILEHRGLAKLKSTYTDKLPLLVNHRSGRIHTCYQQAVAATGRLSSSDPNLQNIPIKSVLGREIRKAFIAEKGMKLISADYSQIELRIMAHLSEDETLIAAFNEGKDVHTATAAEIFGIDIAAVESEHRRKAKAINFGLIYGMSAHGLARQIQVDRSEAAAYIDMYFKRYPGVRQFMDTIREQAARDGYVETLFGRRLYLPDIHATNRNIREGAQRTAINAPMQGTAADIIKRAMLTVHPWLKAQSFKARMVMQVHDELVLEVEEAAAATVSDAVKRLMSGAASLKVPLIVEAGIADNWEAAH